MKTQPLFPVSIALDALNVGYPTLTKVDEHNIKLRIKRLASEQAMRHQVDEDDVLKCGGGYEYCLLLPLSASFSYGQNNSETPAMAVYIGCRKNQRSKMVVSFRGHPLSREHLLYARFWLKELCKNIRVSDRQFTHPTNIVVTSYHIVKDVRERIQNIGVERRNCSCAMFCTESGLLTGVYMGGMKSRTQFVYYDRNKKRQNYRRPVTPYDITRLEQRIKLHIPWNKLEDDLISRLTKETMHFYDIDRYINENKINGMWSDVIKNIGAHSVIAAQTVPSSRRRLRQELQKYEINLGENSGIRKAVKKIILRLRHFVDKDNRYVMRCVKTYQSKFEKTFLY
ncbi:hypothetical protein [Bowmanella pacifica]|uniref:Uncharacterized protein n=1 Tax=Bowmanella pacifica TaxID=502051 RepID=A0A918DHE1_9ALTE|nr:hypothetical protein [Bowmanella pacifica]GGO65343.1 hypothetical protein GCM10010982_06930 [Bowmanella pacifica]